MRWQAVVMGAALVVVAGCTGETTDPQDGASPGGAKPVGAALCEAIPTGMLERFSGDRTPHEDLMLGREQFIGCDTDGLSSFEFGIQVIDSDTPPEEHLTGEVEAFDGLGDEAYRSTQMDGDEMLRETVVARQGDRVVLVRNDLLYDGPERATEEDTIAVANLLLDLPAEEVAAIEKVVVGPPCPSIEQASTVLSDVELARAQDVPGANGIDCSYYSSDDVRLLVSSFQQDNAADFLGNDDPVDLAGATAAEILDSGNGFEITALVGSDTVFHIGATMVAGDDPDAVDRDALIALAKEVLASS